MDPGYNGEVDMAWDDGAGLPHFPYQCKQHLECCFVSIRCITCVICYFLALSTCNLMITLKVDGKYIYILWYLMGVVSL